MKCSTSFSLVIPIYNEEETVLATAETIVQNLNESAEDYELILINDGSSDRTGEILQSLARKYPQVKYHSNLVNLNVGIALQVGLQMATKDFVVHNGIDMPLATEDVTKVVELARSCDVLVLQRESYSGYTSWRWVCSKLNRALLRILFRCPFSDLNFTQVYRRSVLSSIVPLAKSPAFTTPEMIIRARNQGYSVLAIPWKYQARAIGQGAFGRPHDLLWSLYDIFRFWIRGPKSIPTPRNDLPIYEPEKNTKKKASAPYPNEAKLGSFA